MPSSPTSPPLGRGEIALHLRSGLPPLDKRRGLIRISAQVMTALGVSPWDVVVLRGARTTAALVATAPAGLDPRVAWCDDLTTVNAATSDLVAVSRAPMRVAGHVELYGPAFVTESVDPRLLRSALLGKAISLGDQISLLPQDYSLPAGVDSSTRDADRLALSAQVGQGWEQITFQVSACDPEVAGIVAPSTQVRWRDAVVRERKQPKDPSPVVPPPFPKHTRPPGPESTGVPHPTRSTDDVTTRRRVAPSRLSPAGLGTYVTQLAEWLDVDFNQAELLRRLGSTNQLGVLVSGPAGSGVDEVVAAACAQVGASVVTIWGPQVAGRADHVGALRAAAERARESTPAVLVIQDVEALCPADQPPGGSTTVPDTLLLVEDLVRDPRVAVVCTTRAPEAVHRGLRAPGRLDRELAVPVPDQSTRAEMLADLCSSMPLAPDVDLVEIVARTPGFVLADLRGLVREAALRAAYRHRHTPATEPALAATVTREDFRSALDVVRPSAAEGRDLDVPDITLDDVGGLDDAKRVLTEVVLWPLTHPDTFARLGVLAPSGVLLHGPPGCGKTHLVKALAGSGRATVLSVKGAELLSKWVGESERGVRELFRTARAAAPSIIFLDEVDALAPVRGSGAEPASERVVASLLTEMDGIEARTGVIVLAATNRLDQVDPALLRPGRLERHVLIPPPDAGARAQILAVASRRSPLDEDVDLEAVAKRCEGFSAADCDALVREAALTAMRESLDTAHIARRHFEAALCVITPSLP